MFEENVMSELLDGEIKIGTPLLVYNQENDNWYIFRLIGYNEIYDNTINVKGKWLKSNMKEYNRVLTSGAEETIVIGFATDTYDYADTVFKLSEDELMLELL